MQSVDCAIGELLLQEENGSNLIGSPSASTASSSRAPRSSLFATVMANLFGTAPDATQQADSGRPPDASGQTSDAVVDSCAAVLRSMEVNAKRWVATCSSSSALSIQLRHPTESMFGDRRLSEGLTVEQYHTFGEVSKPPSSRSDSDSEVDRTFTACRYHFRSEDDGQKLIVYAMFSPMPLVVFSADAMRAIHSTLSSNPSNSADLLQNLLAMHDYYNSTTTISSFPTKNSESSHARARMSRMIRIEVDLTRDAPTIDGMRIVRCLENIRQPTTVIYDAQGVSENYASQLSSVAACSDALAFGGAGFLHSLAWTIAHRGASAALPFGLKLNPSSYAASIDSALSLLLLGVNTTSTPFLFMKSNAAVGSLYCSSPEYMTQRQNEARISVGSLNTLQNVTLSHILVSTSTRQKVHLQFTLRVFDPTVANFIFVSKDMHGRWAADGHSLNMGLEYACTSPKLVDVNCILAFEFGLKQSLVTKGKRNGSNKVGVQLEFAEDCELQFNTWSLDPPPPTALHSNPKVTYEKRELAPQTCRSKVRGLTEDVQSIDALDPEPAVRFNAALLSALRESSDVKQDLAASLEGITARYVVNRSLGRDDKPLLARLQAAWGERLTEARAEKEAPSKKPRS